MVLCDKLQIPFSEKMLKWPKGKRKTDGLWEKVWYKNVQSSTKFQSTNKKDYIIPNNLKKIYSECIEIYNEIYQYKI